MTLSAPWKVPGIDEWIGFGDRWWWLLAAVTLFARGADLGSTWFASPNLVNEGNPVARRLGWRGGIIMNVMMVLVSPLWPLLAVSLATTSCLVAARNLQSAWLMRVMGENEYREWMNDRVCEALSSWLWISYLGEALLVGIPGVILMAFSQWRLIPFGIGLGMAGFGTAVAFFTTLSLWRRNRA